jgi:glutamate--cysteine ligase/glutathione synthase
MMNSDYSRLELSTQILIREADKRGIDTDVLDWDDNFIRLRKGDKTEYVKQATRTSADTYIAPLIMENKEVTKIVLKEHGVSVPEGITVHSAKEAAQHFPTFAGTAVVIKPKSTNFGKGVIIIKECNHQEEYEDAVTQALTFDDAVLIEQFIPGKEYRFLVIGDEVAAILHRVPANVEGDGRKSIEELVAVKNQDPLRGKGYVTPLEKLALGDMEIDFLLQQGRNIRTVPAEGETVYLRENSNISTGGDSIDCTDTIPEAYKSIAVKAARAVGARICGADMIIFDPAQPPDDHNHSIIELNFNPALHIHDYPYQGQNRHVEQKVLDLLGF